MEEKEEQCKSANGKCAEEKDYGAAFGEAIASVAIDEMNEESAPKSGASAFILKCKREGKHPIEVVKRVAGHYGIKVSEEAPEDETKRKIYFLLKEAVRQYVSSIMDVFGDEVDDGEEDDFSKFISSVFGYSFTC